MITEIKELKFESDYFTLFKLANNCYAAIEKENTLTGSNAGFVDLGDKIIVFDTFLNLDAAKDLIKAVKEITGKKPDFVINSHFHTDHIVGNQLFDVPIIAMEQTKESIEKYLPETMIKLKALPDDFVEKRREEIKSEQDQDNKKNLENELKFIENLLKHKIEVTPPNKIINENIVLEGKEANADIEIVENAHSLGDIIMKIADQKICFMGDLLFSDEFTWIGSGNPYNLIDITKKLLQEDYEYFIPGHGPISTKKDLKLQLKYLEEILVIAKQRLKENKSIKEIQVSDLSAEFQDWDDLVFKWNNNFLETFLKAEE